MKKGVVIYQVTLPKDVAERLLEEFEFFFAQNENKKIEFFFLQEVLPDNVAILCAKITAKTIFEAQISAMPIFRCFALLERAIDVLPEKQDSIHVELDENDPTLIIGKHKMSYQEVFSVNSH